MSLVFFFQAEDGIRYHCVTGVQTCALPILDANGFAMYFEVQRLALAAHLEVHREAVGVYVRHDAQPTSRAPLAPTIGRAPCRGRVNAPEDVGIEEGNGLHDAWIDRVDELLE